MHCPLFWISNPYFISYLECREPLYFIFSRDFLFLFHVGGEAKIQYINYKYYKNSHTRTGESTCVPTLDAAGLRLLLENPADPRPLLGSRGLREVQTSGQENGDTNTVTIISYLFVHVCLAGHLRYQRFCVLFWRHRKEISNLSIFQ